MATCDMLGAGVKDARLMQAERMKRSERTHFSRPTQTGGRGYFSGAQLLEQRSMSVVEHSE